MLRRIISCKYATKPVNTIENVASMRPPYLGNEEAFVETQLICKEPIGLFNNWFEVARKTPGIVEPNAMCLATASVSGVPSARYVLLKGYGPEGFKFFTNFASRKGQDLTENPQAALVFYWEPLRRSVRVEGRVRKVSDAEADQYFQSRPVDSQIGACVSNQSSPIFNRDYLLSRAAQLREELKDKSCVTRPDYWGGFLVVPHAIEFWQGQTDRLHDRIRFRKSNKSEKPDGILLHQGDDDWLYERLAP